jgi:hypothetical protein
MITPDAKIPTLYTAIANSATAVNKKSHQQYGNLWSAYLLVGEILSVLVEQGSENPIEVSESASQRISITTGLLQSSTVVENLISAGFYWAACALLRQHMEALARLIHIRNGASSTEKKSPNVNVLPCGLQKNYGRFSELAHLSNGELLGDFASSAGNDEVTEIPPQYNLTWSRHLLAVHVAHLIVLSTEVYALHMELYPSKCITDIEPSITEVGNILVSEGFWKRLNSEASIVGSDAA